MTNILDTLREATDILRNKPLLRRVRGDAIVSGDLHGDLEALQKVKQIREEKGAENIIFLGDYVDRGDNQLEVVEGLAELIRDDPKVTVLRGNHEDLRVCGRYGFINILENNNLPTKEFGEFFSHLPFAAISSNAYFAHGGIPIGKDFTVEKIRDFDRLSIIGELPNGKQILWNDPIYDQPDELDSLPSPRGPGIYQFGRSITTDFIERHNINIIIRAHIAFVEGYKWMQEKKILSLFTSSSGSYSGRTIGPKYGRKIAYMDLDDTDLKPEDIEIIDISN